MASESSRSAAREAGALLRAWREGRGLRLADMDRITGRTHGTWSQAEVGKLLPPDKALCADIDAGLELAAGTAWRELAAVRLLRLDPDLKDWHKAQLQASTGAAGVSAGLATLLDAISDASETIALTESRTRSDAEDELADILARVLVRAREAEIALRQSNPEDYPLPLQTVRGALGAMDWFPIEQQPRMWARVFTLVLEAALDMGLVKASAAAELRRLVEEGREHDDERFPIFPAGRRK